MALSSLFRRSDPPPEAPPKTPSKGAGDAVDAARQAARRRLIGAVVLLGVGVIAFPLLFETAPRPIPVDLPITIPSKDSVAPLALPAPASPAVPGSGVSPAALEQAAQASAPQPRAVTGAAGAGAAAVAVPPQAAAETAPDAREPARAGSRKADEADQRTPPAPSVKVAPAAPEAQRGDARADSPAKAEAASAAAAADGARARALLEGRSAPAPAAGGRWVVQIGAFAEDRTVRDTRAKAGQLGLQTYTQVVVVEAGKRTRVRVGPFGDRAEADRVADRLKGAGLPASVLKL